VKTAKPIIENFHHLVGTPFYTVLF